MAFGQWNGHLMDDGLSPVVTDGKLKIPAGDGWGLLAAGDLLKDAKAI